MNASINMYCTSLSFKFHQHLILLLSPSHLLLILSLLFCNSTIPLMSVSNVNIPRIKQPLGNSFSSNKHPVMPITTPITPAIVLHSPLSTSLDYYETLNRRYVRSLPVRSLPVSSRCPPSTTKQKDTFLWTISTEPISYLFGTLHVAYTHVWSQIDPIVKQSFTQSDIIYFELDLTDPVTLSELSNCQILPKNQTIASLLKPDLIKRLDEYLNNLRHVINSWVEPEKKIYATYLYETLTKDWKAKRPIWLLLLLNSLSKGEISDRGVPVLDLFLAQEAQRLGKKHGAVEQVNDQCEPLNRINVNQVTFALEMTLNNLENMYNEYKEISANFPHNNNNNNISTFNDNILLNQWNQEFNYSMLTDSKHKQIHRTNLFNSPTEQLIEHYNCGDLNVTLSRMYSTQSNPSKSLTSTEEETSDSSMGNLVITIPDKANDSVDKTHFNKVTDISGQNNDQQHTTTSSPTLLSGYLIDKEITKVLTSSQIQTLIDLENYLNEELIVKRNERMAQEIVNKLKLAETLNQSAFFAIGAAHFLGNGETIIDHLRTAGYTVTPVPRQDHMITDERRSQISEKPLRFEKFNKQLRQQTKVNEGILPMKEKDVPKFRPKYVNFDNSWIKIEDFRPRTFPNPKQSLFLTSNTQDWGKLSAERLQTKHRLQQQQSVSQNTRKVIESMKPTNDDQVIKNSVNSQLLSMSIIQIRTVINIILVQCILFYL
ncbi:unnamed protein product [Trichobilharzia szidati]|nr:unnamed protein product [Trichobilharzia szidati]